MSESLTENLRKMRAGVTLALITFLFGFGLGGAFGAAEGRIKDSLQTSADTVLVSVYKEDRAKLQKTVSKSWSYYKRAHMHAGGMGAAALAMMLLLACFPGETLSKKIPALLLGLGGIGYPLFWLFAGMRAPGLGSTGLAKESLSFLAIASAGCFLLGTLATFALFVRFAFSKKSA